MDFYFANQSINQSTTRTYGVECVASATLDFSPKSIQTHGAVTNAVRTISPKFNIVYIH